MENLQALQIIYDFVVQNQLLSYWIVFIFAILEATIFIGLIVPTGILIMTFGFMSYSGDLIGGLIIVTAILGGLVGDALNYILGKFHYKINRDHKLEKIDGSFLFKKKNYLHHGEEFFKKHGGKSVFFGKFIGMVRPFVSYISGTAQMPFSKFMYFNLVGAFLWVLLYFGIGYFFGSSIETLSFILTKIVDVTFLFALLIIFFIYLRSTFNKNIGPKVIERSEELLEKIDKEAGS
jgi:membrane protein DedA with SNARE-associated domain